ALKRLVVEERLLHGMQSIAAGQRFNRRDRLGPDAGDLGDARSRTGAVEEDGAGATLPFAAPEAAAGQAEVVAENGEEAVARLGVDLTVLTIDAKDIASHTVDCSAIVRGPEERMSQIWAVPVRGRQDADTAV